MRTRNAGGGKSSNGNHSLQGQEPSLIKRILSKLEKALRELEPLVEQGKVTGFFNNVKNADKLGGIAGDIRDAMMDYQVCPHDSLARHA